MSGYVEKIWVTKAGYTACIRMTDMSWRTAYIAIPEGHPWHRMDYDEIIVKVNGGLTYGEMEMDDGFPARLSMDAWWIGWDYGHYSDARYPGQRGKRTWLLEDIMEQCEDAAQAASAALQNH